MGREKVSIRNSNPEPNVELSSMNCSLFRFCVTAAPDFRRFLINHYIDQIAVTPNWFIRAFMMVTVYQPGPT
jgi:hypothetical protein